MQTLIEGLNFPEGPAYDKKGAIWLVEKEAGNLIYYNNKVTERIFVDGHPNGIAIDKEGVIWFCDSKQNSIRQYDPITKETQTVINEIEGVPLKMPNDLCFDRVGNLLFTCPGDKLEDGTGYICCLTPERQIIKIYNGLYYPNGLAFGTDGNTLFVAETGTQWLWKMQWNILSKKIENAIKLCYVGGNVGPDGIAIDTTDHIYIALYGSAKIDVYKPDGTAVTTISTLGRNPTNCAIDPFGETGLIITEAENGTLVQIPTTKKGLL
ncbi:SMP-30/gluconolactonase/LRE family protein [Sphingobacterium psychroaquaticum]|uniref:SMP-30/gluconolactonase/LRE family protein n=1 Tax=Sphingobacterium psychroaquaticum TaxID=561061 RepID=UPI0010691A0C|nr:SMP-30/gluconolactonase/LRE family protein [Sphingobacterium psychroaquaticum]QBQ40980.1 SMP-30/gluconolactonase/LRE family protein [Sphingobacterium psychroaquaticum]